MHKLYLRKREEKRLLSGHQWAFSNELLDVPKALAAGDLAALYTEAHRFLGIGFYHPQSLIAFRLLSATEEPIDEAFFEKRLTAALALRRKLYPESVTNAYRLAHSESDYLPGLVIDKFGDVLSVQTYSAGMERQLDAVCNALRKMFSPKAIVIRNESPLRTLEGLPQEKRIAFGELNDTVNGKVEIIDAGVRYAVDVMEGHKTGFFLDQRENRKRIRPFSKDARVLDVFTSDGGFGLNACYGGAAEVIAIDSSQAALQRASENAALNGFSQFKPREGDAFEMLKSLKARQEKFDLVIVDPPSLTKSKKTLATALTAYRELNASAFSLVKSGGFLATASCSHHASEDDFLNAVMRAGLEAKRDSVLLEKSTQSPDHPVLVSMPETQYLKFFLFYVP